MIRFFSALVILFTSSSLFAFEARTPLSSYKGRYSVNWWNCSRPTKGGLTLVNRIVVNDTSLKLAGCSSNDDLACEAQGNFNSRLKIESMKSTVRGVSGMAATPMFNYEFKFGRSTLNNQLETTFRMVSTFGADYDVTCTSALKPIR